MKLIDKISKFFSGLQDPPERVQTCPCCWEPALDSMECSWCSRGSVRTASEHHGEHWTTVRACGMHSSQLDTYLDDWIAARKADADV